VVFVDKSTANFILTYFILLYSLFLKNVIY